MTTKLAKGVEVWMFGKWNQFGTCYVQKLILNSFGKKQATAFRVKDGKNIKCNIYARCYSDLVAVADMPDPSEEALRRSVVYRQEKIDHYRDTQHWYMDTTTSAYHPHMKVECRKVMDSVPAVILDF